MRRGQIISGVIALLAALALAAPALADPLSATDQGYPCATQPPAPSGQPANCTPTPCVPAAPGQPTTPQNAMCTPATPPPTTPVGQASGTQVVTLTPSSGTLGAQKTIKAKPAAGVAPLSTTKAQGTLPFTGAQLGIFAIVGLALLAGGFLLRSTGRKRHDA